MPDFRNRSRKEELLDQDNIPAEALHQNLRELDTINRLLGGHKATIAGLRSLMKDKTKTYRIVDFACGGGDTLRVIADWAKKYKYKVKLLGFDLLDDAIQFAKENSIGYDIEWKVANFKEFDSEHDISICSLVCHHFYDKTLIDFIHKMNQTAKIATVINDLHRHWFAYYSIAWLTAVFSKSHLVKNDAKLSVLKGFKKQEWKAVLSQCDWSKYTIRWIWAFRHLIIVQK